MLAACSKNGRSTLTLVTLSCELQVQQQLEASVSCCCHASVNTEIADFDDCVQRSLNAPQFSAQAALTQYSA